MPVIGAAQVADALAERLGTRPAHWDQRVLGEVPGTRRVVACTSRRAAGEPRRDVVVKCYADDTGARTARVMAAAGRAVRALPGSAPLRVPQVLFYDAERRMLVQELAGGRGLLELAAGPGGCGHLRAAGAAIATLHRLPVPAGRPRRAVDHVAELMRPHPSALATAVPVLARRVDAVLTEVVARDAVRSDRRAAALVHRDLHLRQLLRDGGAVWLLDWDLAAGGDPALDLGNLVASMDVRLPRAVAAGCADALLEGYGGEAIERCATYEAFTYLRLACKRLRQRPAGWRSIVADLLERAEDALAR